MVTSTLRLKNWEYWLVGKVANLWVTQNPVENCGDARYWNISTWRR